MRSFLERLRQKPDKAKKRIALGTSAAVTSLVFVGWVTVLSYGVVTPGADGQQFEGGATQTASPLTAFSDNASAAFSELKSSFASTASSSQPVADDAATERSEGGKPGMVEGQSTITDSAEKNSADSAADGDSASDSYWDVQNVLSEIENQKTNSASASVSSTPSVQEHFNSRNYNPVQASDWISQ